MGEQTLLEIWKARVLLATGLVLAMGLPAIAAESPVQVPSLSGVWELRYDSVSAPAAELTPQALGGAAIRKGDMESRRWCRVAGMPALMIEARFLDIRQGTRQIAIVPHMQAMTRHLYTDGVPRMNPRDFDPVSNGFSDARWEGAELVVTTTGFSEFGIRSIPGGGHRTTDSVLVERFRLLDGGNRLSVISTWTDPEVFSRPHTYEVRYYRVDPEIFVSPQSCNVFEAGREAFFAPAIR